MKKATHDRLAVYIHLIFTEAIQRLLSKGMLQANGDIIIPAIYVRGWASHIGTPYSNLSSADKEMVQDEVAKVLKIIRDGEEEGD